ncbi:MAG: hypothetical protein U0892_13495 [Pirellulales bacterium]
MQLTSRGRESPISGLSWPRAEQLVVNKLITGSFRIGVSQKLIVRALADAFHLSQDVVSHRLMGDWQPTAEFMQELARQDTDDA